MWESVGASPYPLKDLFFIYSKESGGKNKNSFHKEIFARTLANEQCAFIAVVNQFQNKEKNILK